MTAVAVATVAEPTTPTVTASPARVAANRRNAQRSTGPKTPEGKARARANAIKHGLTGAGVALPTEVREQVEARFLQLQDELAPSDTVGTILVGQMALMSVRLDRAARHEAATLARAIDQAGVEYDLERLAEVDRLFDHLIDHPGENQRRLLTMPEGIDRLIGALSAARDQAAAGKARFWEAGERTLIEAFCGRKWGYFPVSRTSALLAAISGDFRWLAADDPVRRLKPKAQQAGAAQELALALDAEIVRLTTRRAGFDPEALALDRAAAADRALINPGPLAAATHRHETAAARRFHQALRDFQNHDPTLPTNLDAALTLPEVTVPGAPVATPAAEAEAGTDPAVEAPATRAEPPAPTLEPPMALPITPVRQNEPNPLPIAPAWGQVTAGSDRASSVFVPRW